jgi:hypothetical protein
MVVLMPPPKSRGGATNIRNIIRKRVGTKEVEVNGVEAGGASGD